MYIGSDIWQYTGYFATIYLAALTAIDPVLYEAAIMDGANRWQRMWHITLPGILPTITILFILSVGMIVSVGFERVFLLYSPATYETADVLPTYVYRRGIMGYNFSYATAVGLIDSIAATIMVLSANTIPAQVGQERRIDRHDLVEHSPWERRRLACKQSLAQSSTICKAGGQIVE